MGWRNILAVIVTGWPGVIGIGVGVLFLHYGLGWSLLRAGVVGIVAWGGASLFLRREIRSKAYYNKGRYFYERRAYAEAETNYRKAIDLNPRSAWAYGNLAVVIDDQGRHAEALDLIDKAVSLDPQDRDFSEWRGEILEHVERRTQTRAGSLHQLPPTPRPAPSRAAETAVDSERLCREATVHFKSGQYQQAVNCIDQALPIDEARLGRNSVIVAAHFKNRGMALICLQRHKEAIDSYTTAVSIFKDVDGPRGSQVAICLNDLGCAYLAMGDYRQALGQLEQAVSLDRQLYGDHHPDTARHLANLARAQLGTDDAALRAQAKRNLAQARETLARILGSSHPDVQAIEQFERSALA